MHHNFAFRVLPALRHDKTFTRSHAHTRIGPTKNRPSAYTTAPRGKDTVILFDFSVFPHTLQASRRRRNCQRLHARPPNIPEFSLSTWILRFGIDSGTARRETLVLFTFVQWDTLSGTVSVCVLLHQLEENFTFHCVLESPTSTDDANWDGGGAVCCNLTSARCLTLEASQFCSESYDTATARENSIFQQHLAGWILITNFWF